MAQSMFLPSPSLTMGQGIPSSPDPTPLRLLAFSVAEAALQSDPNSPSFGQIGRMPDIQVAGESWEVKAAPRSRLWDVAERAKTRKTSPVKLETALPNSPPVSPSSYNFVLPPNSPLAASIASTEKSNYRSVPPPLKLAPHQVALQTRSAEPSPTYSTFSRLDQTRPPPVFVPRLSAKEFSAEAERQAVSVKHCRTKSDLGLATPTATAPASPSERLRSQATVQAPVPFPGASKRLPSLAQIQAEMSKDTHRRVGSFGTSVPRPKAAPAGFRSDSEESIEVLQTPTDDRKNPLLSIAVAQGDSRPPTPPSPGAGAKEPRLAPFLRDRTSSRLNRVGSPAPLGSGRSSPKPTLTVTPPSTENRPPPLALIGSRLVTSPTRATFNTTSPTTSRFAALTVSTPPRVSNSPVLGSPASPSESIRSFRSSSTSSPTLSMPIITCTPARTTVVKNGVEQESDDESEGEEVVVFDGEVEEAKEREERERMGKAMRDRLGLRRRSE